MNETPFVQRTVGIKALRPNAVLPTYGTEKSACADVRAYLSNVQVKVYHEKLTSRKTVVKTVDCVTQVILAPFQRALIPTGLAIAIPDGYSIRTHPRSGLSAKQGLVVVCGEGVIDEDYLNELYVPIINYSGVPQVIKDGDRIAQMELVRDERAKFSFVDELPSKESSRTGGFGHTGSS